MQKNKNSWLALLLSFFFIFFFSAAVILLQKPSGFIEGRVLDDQGHPLKKARISADAYPRYLKAFSDEQGYFHLDGIPLASYHVSVSAKGYQYYYFPNVTEVKEGQHVQLGELKLKESEPYLSVSINQMTKMPDEKVLVNINGSRIKEISFSAFQIDLVSYLKNGGSVQELQNSKFNPKNNAAIKMIKEWNTSIAEEDALEFDQRLPADLNGAGVFLIHSLASSIDRQKIFESNSLVSKTDIGFIAKRDTSKLLLYVSSFSKQAPVQDAQVYLFSAGQNPIQAKTSSEGLVEIPLSEQADNNTAPLPFVVLSLGEQVAFAWAPHLYSTADDESVYEGEGGDGGSEGGEEVAEAEGEGAVAETEGSEMTSHPHPNPLPSRERGLTGKAKIFLYTERPLYRPGQKVYFKGILRDELENGSYLLPTAQPIEVTLQDPQGNFLNTLPLQTNSMGSFAGEFDLEEEAELGFYSLQASLAGKTVKKEFEVQEYRKPEFKVEVKVEKERYFSGENIRFNVNAQYYFGSPVPANLEYTLYKSKNEFLSSESYGEAEPADAVAGGYGEVVEEGKGKTDAQGNFNLNFKSEKDPLGARYTLRVVAKDLTERQVTVEGDAHVVAGDFYFAPEWLQYFAVVGKPFAYTVKTLGYPETPLAKNFEIKIEKEKWSKRKGQYDYSKVEDLSLQTTAQGQVQAALNFKEGGHYRLSLSAKDSAGREVLYHDFVWVSGKAEVEDYAEQKQLVLLPEKKKLEYKSGELLRLMLINPIENAKVLVTVEGPKIHQYFVQNISGTSGMIEIPLQREWVPNVFVSVGLIGKKEYYEASSEVKISPAEHFLKVQVQASSDKVHPGDTLQYAIKTLNDQGQGVPAEVSLGLVDESIYALKADSTQIKDFFWGAKPNRVSSLYSFSGYLSGGIEKEDKNLLRRNFKDTAVWLPQVLTDAQGEAKVEVKLPDNLTTWQATVVAHDATTDVGQEISKIVSSKDLVARLAIPRFFTERDEAKVKAIVQNFTESPQKLNLAVSVEGLSLSNAEDAKNRLIDLAPKESRTFEFTVKATQAGEAKLSLLAKNDKISDGVELKIPILAHGIEQKSFERGEIAASSPENENPATKIHLNVMPQSDVAKSKLKLSLDSSALGQTLGPLSYLIDYPYGCVEQTSSRLLAAAYSKDLLQVLGQQDPAIEKKANSFIPKGIRRLQKMQSYDGSWGWWKGEQGDLFMSSYALYTLNMLKNSGYEVKDQTLTQASEALTKLIEAAQKNTTVSSSLLNFAQYVEVQNHQKMSSAQVPQTAYDLALKSLTLFTQGQKPKAAELLSKLEGQANCPNNACLYPKLDQGYWMYDKLGSVETSAWALKAMIQQASPNTALEEKIANGLLSEIKNSSWAHTRETAIALSALLDYAKSLTSVHVGVKGKILINGKEVKNITVANPHFVRKLSKLELNAGTNLLEITNLTASNLYYQNEFSQFSNEEDLAASKQGISITREYLRLEANGQNNEGQTLYKASPLSGTLKKGEVLGVRLSFETDQDRPYVIVEDPLPAGFEVFDALRFEGNSLWVNQTQLRDEKISLFVSLLPKGKSVMTYALRPELAGSFHVMPAQIYPMYEPSVRGTGAEARLRVE
ncbi:MAG: carboxypeptidase regulatory-like domain-containing protein [Deltaproteobacteria bacterium]|nr:carboxypeptidase regulatory-like domain-containing protein [Deltaproteobacteria bacterium]